MDDERGDGTQVAKHLKSQFQYVITEIISQSRKDLISVCHSFGKIYLRMHIYCNET